MSCDMANEKARLDAEEELRCKLADKALEEKMLQERYDEWVVSGTVDAKGHALIALLEKEVMVCTKARLQLNNVIADKSSSNQCYENERLQHNQLLQRELRLDNERMKILMRLRRATMREVSYT